MIRPYHHSDDLNAVVDIWYTAVKNAYSFLPDELLESQKHDVIHIYLPQAKTWVAEDNGPIVGFISVYEHVVRALFVSPEYQNRGIGTALVEHVHAINGNLCMEVLKENVRALNFYKKCGFAPTKEGLCAQTGLPTLVGPLRASQKETLGSN